VVKKARAKELVFLLFFTEGRLQRSFLRFKSVLKVVVICGALELW